MNDTWRELPFITFSTVRHYKFFAFDHKRQSSSSVFPKAIPTILADLGLLLCYS